MNDDDHSEGPSLDVPAGEEAALRAALEDLLTWQADALAKGSQLLRALTTEDGDRDREDDA